MIRTYLLHVDELEHIKYDEKDFSERRREKIEKLKRDADKKLATAAELLLIHAVKELDPSVELPLVITEDVHGKPQLETTITVSDELKKAGFRGGKVYFSISHSGEYAACSVSNETVGVDIENIKRSELPHPEKILHKKEAEVYSFVTNPLEKKKYFFECWTLKESYLKNLGIGLVVRSSDFMITEDQLEATNKKLKKRYAHCLKPGEVLHTDWKFDANYKVSYCTPKKDPDAKTMALTAKDFS